MTETLEISVGSDPEVFLEDNGRVVPAIGLVGGSKSEPYLVDGGGFQEDNIMAEINPDPGYTREEFTGNLNLVLDQLRVKVHPLEIHVHPWAEIEDEFLQNIKALEFGCIPDYDAYTGRRNPKVDSSSLANTRCAGGHVHVGFDFADDHPTYRQDVVKSLDLFLGAPATLLEPDSRRKQFYGKAGAYRPTPYGVEYRVLSNFWISSLDYQRWVWDRTIQAVHAIRNQDYIVDHYQATVMRAINGHSHDHARALVEQLGIPMP